MNLETYTAPTRFTNIERWWSQDKQQVLARIHAAIQILSVEPSRDLLNIAFSKKVIEWSNAAFNHQSMSFKSETNGYGLWQTTSHLLDEFEDATIAVMKAAASPLSGKVSVIQADSRAIPQPDHAGYDCVITSPPYPNRMSYIRELRPYMYWLGYLSGARDAAELDWKAIGGTWGVATSRVAKWEAGNETVPYPHFLDLIAHIAKSSPLLANYVHKYFVDMTRHIKSSFSALAPNARVYYIVGNSKFYDTVVPVEEIYASLFQAAGFANPCVTPLRKRNSKKELYEFVVTAQKL